MTTLRNYKLNDPSSPLVIYNQCDCAAQTESCLLMQAVTPMSHSWKEAWCFYYPNAPESWPSPGRSGSWREVHWGEGRMRQGYHRMIDERASMDRCIFNKDQYSLKWSFFMYWKKKTDSYSQRWKIISSLLSSGLSGFFNNLISFLHWFTNDHRTSVILRFNKISLDRMMTTVPQDLRSFLHEWDKKPKEQTLWQSSQDPRSTTEQGIHKSKRLFQQLNFQHL